MKNIDLYREAIRQWGADAQTLMVFEEMAELQKELCKCARGKQNKDEIAEEIADVQIMLEQMMVLHECETEVAQYKFEKLKRLAARLTFNNADTFGGILKEADNERTWFALRNRNPLNCIE